MSTRKPLAARRSHLSVALCAAFAQMTAGAVFAQSAPPASTAEATTQNAEGKIVVTGSRIKRDNYSSTSPVQIITNEETTLAGFSSTAEALQSTGVTGGQGQVNNSFGGFVTEGGPGANTIGLRGFGPTRSQVLLNGRRVTPSGTRGSVGAADLNVLPQSIVDHIEVLKDGASSIYGSDAVAGVVNVVTKKKIDGMTIDLSRSFSSGDGGGSEGFSLVGGTTGDRFNFSGAFEYQDRAAVSLGDRDWTQCNTDYRRTVNADGSVGAWGSGDFIDPTTGKPKCYPITTTGANGSTINTIGTSTRAGVGAPGSVGTSFNRWRPNAAVTTGVAGFEGVGGGTNNINVRDTFDPRMLKSDLISPGSITNVFLQGGYDLKALGDAELYFELLNTWRETQQTGYRQFAFDYTKGSPLIPANLAFSTVGANLNSKTPSAVAGVRAFVGYGNYLSNQSVEYGKAIVGLRGKFIIPGWDYDFNVSVAKSSGDYSTESFLADRLGKSLDVVASGSGFACRDTSGGCVAAPALTAAVIGGQLPADWLNYIRQTTTGTTIYEEKTASFGITGKLFSVPYGKVRGALGAEVRSAKIDDTPSLDSQNNNTYAFSSSVPTRGKDAVREVYGEIEVPILADLPFAEELTTNLSARYTDYDSYGSDSTHKVGVLWTPVSWATLRAASGTSYRAPALFEQFLGATTGFASSTGDPCNDWDNPAKAGTVRSKNCASEGLPPGFTQTSSIKVTSVGGAAAGLKAETSKNVTYGIVLQPDFGAAFGSLSLAADYFDIEVSNGVSRIGSAILSRCYDDPEFRAGGSYCKLVTRETGSNALGYLNSSINLATDLVRGIDYTARYVKNIGPGKFRANLSITHFKEQSSKLFPDDPLDDSNGQLTAPRQTGTLDLNYTYQAWTVRYGLDWVGKQSNYELYEDDPNTSAFKRDVPDYFLHSMSVRYKADKWEAVAGVRNLTDKTPPMVSSGTNVNRVGNSPLYSGYDYYGRMFFLNVSRAF